MVVKNITKKTILAKNCKQAATLMELVFGLHWLSNPPELLFKTRFGIHTLGLKKPIDAVILNDQFKVVKLKQNLKPNNLFFWNPRYQWVLELPAEILRSSKTKLGDQLNFDPNVKT